MSTKSRRQVRRMRVGGWNPVDHNSNVARLKTFRAMSTASKRAAVALRKFSQVLSKHATWPDSSISRRDDLGDLATPEERATTPVQPERGTR